MKIKLKLRFLKLFLILYDVTIKTTHYVFDSYITKEIPTHKHSNVRLTPWIIHNSISLST